MDIFICITTVLQTLLVVLCSCQDAPTWIRNVKTMSPHTVKRRCNVQDLGCFTFLSGYQKSNLKPPITHERCLHKCYNDYMKYSGMKNDECYCGKTLDNFISNKECGADCSIEKADNCNSKDSIRIYKLDIFSKSCDTGFKEDILEDSRVGCLALPYHLPNDSSVWSMAGMTGQQCVLQCELFKYTVAMTVKKFEVCICSYVSTMFEQSEDVILSKLLCTETNLKSGKVFPLYRTSSWDDQCMHRKFFANYPIEKSVSVTGYAGSGTTWLRHLIEVLTGYYTGNHGEEHGTYEDGMLGEKIPVLSGRTAVNYVMFRNFLYRSPPEQDRVVLIIRNPYETLKSAYASVMTGSRKISLQYAFYQESDFHNFVLEEIVQWQVLPIMVLNRTKETPVLLVYYEDLVNDTIKELRRIADFLPHSLTGSADRIEKRLICTAVEMKGNFKRSEKYKTDNDPYEGLMKYMVRDSVRELDKFLKENGFQTLPKSYYR